MLWRNTVSNTARLLANRFDTTVVTSASTTSWDLLLSSIKRATFQGKRVSNGGSSLFTPLLGSTEYLHLFEIVGHVVPDPSPETAGGGLVTAYSFPTR